MAAPIRIIVTGALGKMGRETVHAVGQRSDMEIVGLVDVKNEGCLFSGLTGTGPELAVMDDLQWAIEQGRPDIMVDFTNPQAVFNNARVALTCGVACVVGTTGLNEIELDQLDALARANATGVAVIPNFAIGAVLMMKFAREAAQYLPDLEIIEIHHDRKMDAPSGTALKTAEMINANRGATAPKNIQEFERLAGSRGGNAGDIRIHSVRLPGFVAHQEVIFGGPGQSLTIRHDSYERSSFMPGVLMVVQRMQGIKGLVYGMDALL